PTTLPSPLSLHDALPILARLTPRRHRLPRRQVLLKGGEPMTTASRITRRTVLSAAVAAPLTLAACGNRTVMANERGDLHSREELDRKSTRLNSSHVSISY